jgi:primosomal protein N' (replication factor Y)
MSASNGIYADILLPLALENTYTYLIPEDLAEKASFGMRVEVQFGARKRYAGLIVRMGVRAPEYRTKEIISILDQEPVILPGQYKIWQWMAGYYCCTLGEVMKAALPGALLLSSETIIKAMPVPEDDVLQLGEPLYMLFRIIEQRTSITLEDLQKASGLKALYPHIVKLYQLGMILVVEELEEKYIPKKIKLVGLGDAYRSEEGLQQILEEVAKSEKQTHVVLSYLALAGKDLPDIDPKAILTRAEVGKGVLQTLIQKGIFKEVTKEVNRMDRYGKVAATAKAILTPVQEKALQQIQHQWKEKEVVLLHGVTGSGKTIIYTEIIQEVINQGGQVLYLLPEIGMSVQLLSRFKEIFGSKITTSHSRLNENERVDVWNQVAKGIPVVAGVRSSIFLPFQNLKLIIVDEEHDSSYKQQEPNPRYHARDMAIVLGKEHNAKVLLGSATPSIESYYQSESGKYGRVEIDQRYQGLELPKVMLIDRRKDKSSAGSMYSHSLIEEIKNTLAHKKQVIIFKNRRGYAPVLKCGVCEWLAECNQCDVALTYHKGRNVLVCHLCGTTRPILNLCPACGSPRLVLEGYGTEKIEDELSVIFPDANIKRMDLDTTRGKTNLENLIYNFEQGNIDILVGTQMVTKGLDFDHVGLVGVIYADQALHYPDFRAAERTFQTLVQVSGRAGRKFEQGNVMIQTFQPGHPVFADVISGDYKSFYEREIKEREVFRYPPFVRQIALTIRHKHADMSREAAQIMAIELRALFGARILGPSVPSIARIRNQYIHMIYIKMERDGRTIAEVKNAIKTFQSGIVKMKSLSTVRISVDVDPYH